MNNITLLPYLLEIAEIYNLHYSAYECSYPVGAVDHMFQHQTSYISGDNRWITLHLIVDGGTFKIGDHNSLDFLVDKLGCKLLQWIKLMGIPEGDLNGITN